MNIDELRTKAEQVEELTGCELYDVYPDGGNQDSFEDDGILHVVINGNRAAFDVSQCQNLDEDEQNENTRLVMSEFGLEVTERVLA